MLCHGFAVVYDNQGCTPIVTAAVAPLDDLRDRNSKDMSLALLLQPYYIPNIWPIKDIMRAMPAHLVGPYAGSVPV